MSVRIRAADILITPNKNEQLMEHGTYSLTHRETYQTFGHASQAINQAYGMRPAKLTYNITLTIPQHPRNSEQAPSTLSQQHSLS